MKAVFCLGFSLVIFHSIHAQKQADTDAIVAEGKRLYQSEMASWYGTDIFIETPSMSMQRHSSKSSSRTGIGSLAVGWFLIAITRLLRGKVEQAGLVRKSPGLRSDTAAGRGRKAKSPGEIVIELLRSRFGCAHF